jgi:phage-related protein
MNVFELFAKLGLDSSEYESGLDKARGMLSTVGGGIARGLGALGAASGAALGAAATGVVNLTRQSVNAFANYEQLAGGIETLYGDAASSMMDFASQAATTTGQSMNDFMDAAIATSAAMISSVEGDQARAAELTNQSMIDMADNANKLGTDMESIQNAYRGFSRGNFTMLDNLALGYAGTAEGMQQLLADAQAISGVEYDISSYSDIVEAIHVVQEEMGIAGTTSREASETISGSLGALSASWQNLVTGITNPDADLGVLISDVVDKAQTALGNLTPAITQALGGIASLIEQIAPVISEQLPTLIDTVLPPLLDAATTLVLAVADNLPDILSAITSRLPDILNQIIPVIVGLIPSLIVVAGQIISAIASALVDNAVELAQAGLEVMQTLVDGFLSATEGDGLTELLDVTMQIIEMLANFLIENAPALMGAATELISQLILFLTSPDNLGMMVDLALQLMIAIADGLVQAIPNLVSVIPQIIGSLVLTIVSEFPNLLLTIGDLIGDLGLMVLGLVGGLMGQSYDEVMNSLQSVLDYVAQSFDDFINGLTGWISDIGTSISGMWTDIKDWFTGGIEDAMEALSGWWDEISGWFSDLASNALTWAGDMIDNFVSGITGGVGRVGEAVSGIADSIRSLIGFSEPEIGPLSNFHTFAPDMIDLFAQGIEENLPTIGLAMNNMSGYVADSMPSMEATGNVMNNQPPIVVQAYFGNEKFDEYVVNSNQRNDFISGGRG